MERQYAKQIVEWAEEAKQTLTIRKEIILDENTTDEQLGSIIRQMYKAKAEAEDEQIKRANECIKSNQKK